MAESERPRERLWKQGAESLKTSELLAILIRTGMKGRSALGLGEFLLQEYGSLDRLARVSAPDLARIKGIGPAKAVQLKAAFALGARLAETTALSEAMETPADVQRLLGDAMRQLNYESLRVVALNTRLRVLAVEEVSRGTVNETIAHPRDIFRVALTHHAYAVAVVHNHPSGDPTPSPADIDMTRRLRDAAELLQIVLLDHIILGTAGENKGYYSFKEAGYL